MSNLAKVRCVLIICAALMGVCGAQSLDLDLSRWGYHLPDKKEVRPRIVFRSHFVSIDANGDVAVGFVTHDRNGLVTREIPSLTFHVLEFDKAGELLFERAFPTATWFDNVVEFTSKGTLLVRAGENLLVTSRDEGSPPVKKLLRTPRGTFYDWQIELTPNRQEVVLYNFSYDESELEVLDAGSLSLIRKCPFSRKALLTSVSDDSVAASLPAPANHPGLRRVEVAETCGRSRFEYSWNDGPARATLLSHDSLAIAGFSATVSVVAARKGKLWDRSFKGHNRSIVPHLERNAQGELFAFAIQTLSGGKQIFDLTPTLNAISLVSAARCGSVSSEIKVVPVPEAAFSFALSPDGSYIGYVSDEHLHIQRTDIPTCRAGKEDGATADRQ